MKIALIGYGKMGKTIEKMAEARGHRVVLKIDIENREELTAGRLAGAEVAIEFTRPESAFQNIKAALEAGVPVVSGTTGWLDRMEDIKGSIEVGKVADFCIIGDDILTADPHQIGKIPVLMTIVDGRIVFDESEGAFTPS